MANGDVYADGTYYGAGGVTVAHADYAEYFFTEDTDLQPGEAVCVDILKDNAVLRCRQTADANIMGIISTAPAFLGNATEATMDNPSYVKVAMLGQIPTKASAENGAIRPGDSLSAASIPGYVMKANPGDSTVGVALEKLESGQGTIQVMISRRNKTVTVEEVEKQVTQHIAEMEIEDEVQLLVQAAVKNYDLASEVKAIIDPTISILDSKFTLSVSEINDRIAGVDSSIIQNSAAIKDLQAKAEGYALASTTELLLSEVAVLKENASTTNNTLDLIQGQVSELQTQASTTQTQLAQLLAVSTSTILTVDNTDIAVNNLTVRQTATFYGTITVRGEAGFEHRVTFYEDIEVKGKIYASKDQAGTATIKANSSSTEIIFEKEYLIAPKVVANLAGDDETTFVNFKVARKTAKGFTIILQNQIEKDLTFDWIALAVKSEPPVIAGLTASAETANSSSTLTILANVADPDTQPAELKYVWEMNPMIGAISGEANSILWTLPGNAVAADTDVEIKVTVTDGGAAVSQTKTIKVLADPAGEVAGAQTPDEELPAEELPAILGCLDPAAANFDPAATEDDGSCAY
jgi:hypothetical protein